MSLIKNCINKHPLLIYFILVFIISWGVIFLLAGPSGFPVTEQQAMKLGMAILLGPSVAGILLIGLFSGRSGYRDLLSRLLKWRVEIRWYAVALLTAPLSTAAVIILLSFFSSEFHPSIFLSDEKTTLLMLAIMGGLTVGIFEELGWTGFAVPIMKRLHGVVISGIIIGLIWGAWHFPLFWETSSFTSFFSFSLLIVKLFSWLPPYRVLMVWVYEHTESLFLIILMHVILVATLLTLDPTVTGGGLLIFILVRAIVLWGIVGVVAFPRGRAA